MKINIDVELPSPYKDVEMVSKVIGESNIVKGYTITDDLKLIEVDCVIESDGFFNYHNNYDNSRPVMKVKLSHNWEHRWFSLNKKVVEEKYEHNKIRVVKHLENIINKL